MSRTEAIKRHMQEEASLATRVKLQTVTAFGTSPHWDASFKIREIAGVIQSRSIVSKYK